MAAGCPFPGRILPLLLVSFAAPALASERATGTFEAVRACEAYTSFKKGTNPGNITLQPGQSYTVEEVNAADWDWVRVNVPDISNPLRWVPKGCGVATLQVSATPTTGGTTPPAQTGGKCTTANTYDSNVLAMSWQPGFCEHFRYSGRKPECDALADGELVITHLTLHGLWPNKESCGTHYGNCQTQLGGLDLDEETVAQVAPWMPNLMYETKFASYEWNKHGSCQNKGDDDFFRTAQRLTANVDRSVLGEYIKSHIGQEVSVNELFTQVRNQLGPEVEQRIMLVCAGGRYLQEIRVNLPRDPVLDPDLAKMVAGAPKMRSRTDKCDSDRIYIERSGKQ